MTGPRRGRGRPIQFDDTARTAYLAAVTEGAKLSEAARAVGLTIQTINNHVRTDPSFAAAREVARTHGRKVRAEDAPHGESRYKHAGCRCDICTPAATQARTERRHRTTRNTGPDDPEETAPVLQLPPAALPTREVLPLARAS